MIFFEGKYLVDFNSEELLISNIPKYSRVC